MPIPEVGEADVDIGAPEHVKNFEDFGRLVGSCIVCNLSDNPEGGLTRLVLPFVKTDDFPPHFPRFISDKDGYSPEPMLNALAVFAYRIAASIDPAMIQDVTVKMLPHKAEFLELDDGPWFHKGCSSNRLETCLLQESQSSAGKKKQLCMYLGGGKVDEEQTDMVGNVVCEAKSWKWAAVLSVAVSLALISSWSLPEWPRLIVEKSDSLKSLSDNKEQNFLHVCGEIKTDWSKKNEVIDWPMEPGPDHDTWRRIYVKASLKVCIMRWFPSSK